MYCVAAAMLTMTGEIAVQMSGQVEVELERANESLELLGEFDFRNESRKSVACVGAFAALRSVPVNVCQINCCGQLHRVSEQSRSGHLPGSAALAPLLL